VAGNASAAEIRELLAQQFPEPAFQLEVYETTGKENVAELTRKMCDQGVNLVIAAGGDGTVAGVVTGLIGTNVPLGILPAGTGNGLARGLGMDLSLEQAVELIGGQHTLQPLDVMRAAGRCFVLNVSVGISSRAMRRTGYELKRRFGMLAYYWIILQELVRFRGREFRLTVDDHQVVVGATEILVSNGVLLPAPAQLMGPPEGFNDQQFEIHILTANNLLDYLRLVWDFLTRVERRKTDLRQLTVKNSVRIESLGPPHPVQADGELIGQTPVDIEIIPSAVRVIVPLPEEGG
jgi:diacylglycerol kinase (ATP)